METGLLSVPVWIAVVLLGVWITLWSLARLIEPSHSLKEPPLIRSNIPLLGHVWGSYKHGPKYFQVTSALTKAPIHTLNIFNGKTYVITSPDIVAMVSRNSKSISFNPFISELGIRLTQASDEARQIIERNIDGSEGKDSYVIEIHDRTVAALAPGPEMHRISHMTLMGAWTRFLKPIEEAQSPTRISVYAFIRHMLTISSSTALYGANNPMLADPSLEGSFWEYIANLNLLIIDIHPSLTARKAHQARVQIAHAFRDYFAKNPVGKSSSLAEARYLIAQKHGMSLLDTGRLEVGTILGILVNTAPTIFYTMFHIFQSPSLLKDIREELQRHAIQENTDGKLVLNMVAARSHCQLLNSVLQETLRTYSEGATVRLVCEDTTIDNQYLLKKGAVLQMPNSVIHRDKQAWGDLNFDPKRFLKERRGDKTESTSTTSNSSFRPFGGGSTLCPGRHYATMEVIGFIALFVWRFDMAPVSKSGWVLPKPVQYSVVEAVFPPGSDLEVDIEPRKDAEAMLAKPWAIAFE